MGQNHWIGVPLARPPELFRDAIAAKWPGEDSKASVVVSWSRQPTGKALVFIHGFRGQVLTSWGQFPELLRATPELHGHDIYFYGYASTERPTATCAFSFHEFLKYILTTPSELFVRADRTRLDRPADFSYASLDVVAHSMGAVVARLALLTAYQNKAVWGSRVRVALFAPAHLGGRLSALAADGVAGIPWLRLAWDLAQARSPALTELLPGSSLLNGLRDGTSQAIAAGDAEHLRAKLVVRATRETVVVPDVFPNDPPENSPGFAQVDGDHKTVCKPSNKRTRPLDVLVEVI